MFFETYSKGPGGLTFIFLITHNFPTLEPIDGLTFVFHGVLVLGGNQDVFDGTITLEVGLNAILAGDLLDAFT